MTNPIINSKGTNIPEDRWNRILPFDYWLLKEGYYTHQTGSEDNPVTDTELFNIHIPENHTGFIGRLRLTNFCTQDMVYKVSLRQNTGEPWTEFDRVIVKTNCTDNFEYKLRMRGVYFLSVAMIGEASNDNKTYYQLEYAVSPYSEINRGWTYPVTWP